MQEKADELRKKLRRHRAQIRERVPPSQRRRICDDDLEEENDQGCNGVLALDVSPRHTTTGRC